MAWAGPEADGTSLRTILGDTPPYRRACFARAEYLHIEWWISDRAYQRVIFFLLLLF
jgi:hypothetical protein